MKDLINIQYSYLCILLKIIKYIFLYLIHEKDQLYFIYFFTSSKVTEKIFIPI